MTAEYPSGHVLVPHRVPVVLLLDSSGSMLGDRFAALTGGVDILLQTLHSDRELSAQIDLAVITFSDTVDLSIPMQPASIVELPDITPGGGSALGRALGAALDVLADQSAAYHRRGVWTHRPWLVVATDGQPTDDLTGAQLRLHSLERPGPAGMTILPLALGATDIESFPPLSRVNAWVSVANDMLPAIFQWLAASLMTVVRHRPDARVELPPPGWFGQEC